MAEGDRAFDTAVDELYTADLDEFVARRDQLARELRTGGDREGAAAVKQLRKPSRVAWAVNQAVRRAPDRFEAVLDAGRSLRDAQQRALREGSGTGLHDVMRARQRAVHELTDVAVDALGATGPTARDAIEQTLNAASIDDSAANAVREARLTQELEPPDVFSTLEVGPARAATSVRESPRHDDTAAAPAAKPPPVDKAAHRRAREAEAAADAARAEADRAARDHDAAKAQADELAQRARAAAQAADDARDAARDAAAHARDARRRAEQAEKEARRARAAAGD